MVRRSSLTSFVWLPDVSFHTAPRTSSYPLFTMENPWDWKRFIHCAPLLPVLQKTTCTGIPALGPIFRETISSCIILSISIPVVQFHTRTKANPSNYQECGQQQRASERLQEHKTLVWISARKRFKLLRHVSSGRCDNCTEGLSRLLRRSDSAHGIRQDSALQLTNDVCTAQLFRSLRFERRQRA